ncbi:MAG: tripartite tricarboxylate transporter substrate binding protein [Betaproteobacteria bacterium]|nr:tripartite tricarboxylate transporter substrate binding protein [Betaproteobacteria bacterium]
MRAVIARALFAAGALAAAFLAVPQPVALGAYPEKAIRWIVPWPPGGGADTLSRILSPYLSDALKQTIVIDNRGGAAGNIGAELAAKAPADGYTILFAFSGTHAINPHIYKRVPFTEKDFAPIIWLSSVPQVVVVHPSLPVHSVKELIALARKRPGELTYGSSGSGAFNHLTAAMFTTVTGTQITHVPYKGGGPAAVALVAGEITMILGEPASVIGFVKAGKVRALAVTSAKRALGMPELPTMQEAGIAGFEATSWNGMLAPAGTPAEAIKRLNAEFNRMIAEPEVKKRMLGSGFEPVGGAPEAFGAHIRSEIAKWGPVVKAAGVKVD